MNVLSMGMTGDYMVAVEEGATYVRARRKFPGQGFLLPEGRFQILFLLRQY